MNTFPLLTPADMAQAVALALIVGAGFGYLFGNRRQRPKPGTVVRLLCATCLQPVQKDEDACSWCNASFSQPGTTRRALSKAKEKAVEPFGAPAERHFHSGPRLDPRPSRALRVYKMAIQIRRACGLRGLFTPGSRHGRNGLLRRKEW